MKRLRKQHMLEQSIYGAIWIVIFLLPLIGGYFAMSGGLEREETRMIIRESWLSILPFFVLFLLNNYGLVPYFLFKKRYWQYTVSLIFVIGMICWLSPVLLHTKRQLSSLEIFGEMIGRRRRRKPTNHCLFDGRIQYRHQTFL